VAKDFWPSRITGKDADLVMAEQIPQPNIVAPEDYPWVSFQLSDPQAAQGALSGLTPQAFEALRQIMEREAIRRAREDSNPEMFRSTLRRIQKVLNNNEPLNNKPRAPWAFGATHNGRGSELNVLIGLFEACCNYADDIAYDNARAILKDLRDHMANRREIDEQGPYQAYKTDHTDKETGVVDKRPSTVKGSGDFGSLLASIREYLNQFFIGE